MVFMFASKGIEKLLITRTKGVEYVFGKELSRLNALYFYDHSATFRFQNIRTWVGGVPLHLSRKRARFRCKAPCLRYSY